MKNNILNYFYIFIILILHTSAWNIKLEDLLNPANLLATGKDEQTAVV